MRFFVKSSELVKAYKMCFDRAVPLDICVVEGEAELIKFSNPTPVVDTLKESLQPDAVNHPSHYASGKIEVIEALEDWKLNYHRGNAVKYLARAGKKDPTKEIQDLEKAAWYVNREIERLKATKENREPVRPNNMTKTKASTSATDAYTSGHREAHPGTVEIAKIPASEILDEFKISVERGAKEHPKDCSCHNCYEFEHPPLKTCSTGLHCRPGDNCEICFSPNRGRLLCPDPMQNVNTDFGKGNF